MTRKHKKKNIAVLVPRDLVATMNADGEKYFLEVFDKFFGNVVSSSTMLEYLHR